MSPTLPDAPIPLPRIARRPRPEAPEQSDADALPRIRALSHYRPGYDYRPEQYRYTETHTTDPDYVVLEVRMMSPTREHGEALDHMRNALHILVRRAATVLHVSREVIIVGIPGHLFPTDRHTAALEPDLSVWAGPPPAAPFPSYRYARDGVPLLTVEVVSHSDRERQDNDWYKKRFVYAGMGIREYWIVDDSLPDPLRGFTLDGLDGTVCSLPQYRPLTVDAEGGQDSLVLDASLRWAEGDLQCWCANRGAWLRVTDIPILQAERKGELQGELKGELKTWGRILHRLLDAAAPGAAAQVLQRWTQTAPSAWPSDETLDRLEATPEAWRSLLLGEASPDDDAD